MSWIGTDPDEMNTLSLSLAYSECRKIVGLLYIGGYYNGCGVCVQYKASTQFSNYVIKRLKLRLFLNSHQFIALIQQNLYLKHCSPPRAPWFYWHRASLHHILYHSGQTWMETDNSLEIKPNANTKYCDVQAAWCMQDSTTETTKTIVMLHSSALNLQRQVKLKLYCILTSMSCCNAFWKDA